VISPLLSYETETEYGIQHISEYTRFLLPKGIFVKYQDLRSIMGGVSVAAIGYEVMNVLDEYIREQGISPENQAFKSVLRILESEASIPLALVRLEDVSGSRTFLCFHVEYEDEKVSDCEELMEIAVPPQFARLKESMGIAGDVKRVFGPKAVVFSYGTNGRSRVKAYGLDLAI
jgi:hypothetical protein